MYGQSIIMCSSCIHHEQVVKINYAEWISIVHVGDMPPIDTPVAIFTSYMYSEQMHYYCLRIHILHNIILANFLQNVHSHHKKNTW